MSRAQGPGLFFQNENLNIHNEGGPVLKKTNTSISKTSHKKVGGNRRALQDLSNSGIVNQNQNLDIRKEGPFVKKTSGSFSKTSQTKAGGNRKALQDLSNSLSVHPDATTKKKTLNRGEIGVTEERFLHNPHQCTAARKAEMDRNIHDAVLLEHGLLEPDMSPLQKETELVPCSSPPKCLELESVPELSISAKADMCSSPIQLDSPSPTVSLYELPELKKSMPRAREAELTFQGQNLVHHNDHNVLEEGFLHDHNKCTEAHRAQMDHDLYIKVLLEHGLTHSQVALEEKETLVTYNSPPRYMNCEEIPELPMSTIVDFCSSPNQIDSPTFSPSWYELPELMLSVEG